MPGPGVQEHPGVRVVPGDHGGDEGPLDPLGAQVPVEVGRHRGRVPLVPHRHGHQDALEHRHHHRRGRAVAGDVGDDQAPGPDPLPLLHPVHAQRADGVEVPAGGRGRVVGDGQPRPGHLREPGGQQGPLDLPDPLDLRVLRGRGLPQPLGQPDQADVPADQVPLQQRLPQLRLREGLAGGPQLEGPVERLPAVEQRGPHHAPEGPGVGPERRVLDRPGPVADHRLAGLHQRPEQPPAVHHRPGSPPRSPRIARVDRPVGLGQQPPGDPVFPRPQPPPRHRHEAAAVPPPVQGLGEVPEHLPGLAGLAHAAEQLHEPAEAGGLGRARSGGREGGGTDRSGWVRGHAATLPG